MEAAEEELRVRARKGPARIVDGVPYADRETTLSLLPGAAIGKWLARHRDVLRGRLLDHGCGDQPFRSWYTPLVDQVVGLDAAPLPGVSVRALADDLPFADRTFDTVLSTEVLEHVTDAERATAELFRVLRPGGHALVTVPYLYPTHEAPYDFRRFTHFGLADLLRRHGFDVLALETKGGPGLLAAHAVVLAVQQTLGGAAQRRTVRDALSWPQEVWIRRRGVRLRIGGLAERVSLGYMALARRPSPGPSGSRP